VATNATKYALTGKARMRCSQLTTLRAFPEYGVFSQINGLLQSLRCHRVGIDA
jgi:hypothetical protein